jgi:hypothetical protein
MVQHGGDYAQLLAHATGQLPGEPVPHPVQPGPRQEFRAALACLLRRDAVGRGAERQVLGDRQVGAERE